MPTFYDSDITDHFASLGLLDRFASWKQYKRKGLSEMRPYIFGEDLSWVSVSKEDDPKTDMGMVARNPKNHADQWYVARQYFEDNLEPAFPETE